MKQLRKKKVVVNNKMSIIKKKGKKNPKINDHDADDMKSKKKSVSKGAKAYLKRVGKKGTEGKC